MKKFINIIIILSIATFANAQVYQAFIDAAEQAYDTKDYRSAVSYYGEAIDMEEEVDIALLQKYAESAFQYKAYKKAESAYLQLSSSDDATIQLEALSKLALINTTLGEYAEAKTFLETYFSKEDENTERKARANKCLADIEWALSFEDAGNYAVERLGDDVNTEYSEMSPSTIDGIVYYSSNNYFASNEVVKPRSKIYANKDGKTDLVSSDLNEGDYHVGHYAMNSDQSVIYFTRCKYELNEVKCKIYKQNLKADNAIEELPVHINTAGAHTSQPNIGVDAETGEEVLYFVSDRTGGKGGMDIYYAPIKNGAFKGPFALDAVNTQGDDVSPFYHSSTHQLYFSTDGRKTFGGYDIHSVYNGEQWGEVINLGPSINSSYNEAYFTLSDDGKEGLFSSNRVGSEYIDSELEACCYDIYRAQLEISTETLLAKLFDAETKRPLQGVELVLSALPVAEDKVFYDNAAVDYKMEIRRDLTYSLFAEKAGYEPHEIKIKGDNSTAETEILMSPIALQLNGFVLSEDKEKLSDYTYTITPEDEASRKSVNIGNGKRISDKISKHQDYTIKVEKEGYYPETLVLKQEDLLKEEILDLDIVLKKIPAAVLTKLTLDGYLPMPLFFDNDEPDQNTVSTTTTKNYHQTYLSYFQRRDEYVTQNTAGLDQERKLDVESSVLQFFDNKVKFGDTALEGFTEHLLRFLQQGSQAEIMLRGYASPRSQSSYNDALTSRRVRSVENHFYQWRGGALVPYINSGQLKLTERPLGESQAPPSVSDEISDIKASIYSVDASYERRVEILEITSSNVSQ